MAESKRSWLDGPEIQSEYEDPLIPSRWPGENLGLPKDGSGSVGSVARRAGGVFIDWIISLIVANFIVIFTDFFGGVSTVTILFWVLLGIVSVWLFARTPGQAVLGMGVARVDEPGSTVGLWRSVVRTLLTAFVLPAALVDTDTRGMHDRATGTVVLRS